MSTLLPALVAIGGIEEVALATWGTRIVHVLRKGIDILIHFEGDSVSTQLAIPTTLAPKRRVACVVLDNDLMLAWSEGGTIKFMSWSLAKREVVTTVRTVTSGESPTLEVFRSRKLAIGYTLDNNNYRRNSSSRGVSWGVQILDHQGDGPLRELDMTTKDRAGFVADWIETDAVVVPPEANLYTMDSATISGVTLSDLMNNQNGTLVGGVSTVAGFEGEALSFDGVNDEVNLDGIAKASSASYTISTIVRWASFPGTQRAIFDTRAGTQQRPASLLIGPAGVTFEVAVQTTPALNHALTLLPNSSVYNNTWHNLTVVYDHTRRLMRGFLNGRRRGEMGVSSSNVSSAAFRLGNSPTVAGMFFPGLIDKVRIWNVALTDKQVAAL